MTLITSISGIRGTIGGIPGANLTPPDLVGFSSAFATLLKRETGKPKVVVGRDGRITGASVQALVMHSLVMMGIDVVDAGLSTTPTIEMAVMRVKADGGIIITASHNPQEWNALKFLNSMGECISEDMGRELLDLAAGKDFDFAGIDTLGQIQPMHDAIDWHVSRILELEIIHLEKIRKKGFHVVADCINSTGSLAIPALLTALGCSYTLINAEIDGRFSHDPEPLPSNLSALMQAVRASGADLGIAVDPDVDRLAFVCEDGTYFGEEYTLVAVAQSIFQRESGPAVSNLSSSAALKDVALASGNAYFASAVGEVHVVRMMKETNAIIGGEGNGGVIYPGLHYGRDALVGIAIVLSHLAGHGIRMSEWRKDLPMYFMSKNKVNLSMDLDVEALLNTMERTYADAMIDRTDGLKISFTDSWVHLRKSNTEPVVRIYTEAKSQSSADELCAGFKAEILTLQGLQNSS